MTTSSELEQKLEQSMRSVLDSISPAEIVSQAQSMKSRPLQETVVKYLITKKEFLSAYKLAQIIGNETLEDLIVDTVVQEPPAQVIFLTRSAVDEIFYDIRKDAIETVLQHAEELELIPSEDRNVVLDELTNYCIEYPQSLARLIGNEQFQLLEELAEHPTLRPFLIDSLVTLEYYEEAIKYLMKYTHYTNQHKKDEIFCAFAENDPVQALLYAKGNNYPTLKQMALQHLLCPDDSALFLEAYQAAPTPELREELVDAFYDHGKTIYSLKHYPEIQMHALEVKDTYTLGKIAHELLENACDEEGYEEALAIAYEADEWDIIDKFIDAAEDDEVRQYTGLLDIADSIIGQVASDFKVELPQKVRTGGPAGSYASIRYSSFGGEKNVPDNDSVSEIRATP